MTFLPRKEKLPSALLLDYGLRIPLQGKYYPELEVLFLCICPQTIEGHTRHSVQVDEQSVFRHRGERKVKTVEEDMEEVTSEAAELLVEGEELIGSAHKTNNFIYCVQLLQKGDTAGSVAPQGMTAATKISVRKERREMEGWKRRLTRWPLGITARMGDWPPFPKRTTWRERSRRVER